MNRRRRAPPDAIPIAETPDLSPARPVSRLSEPRSDATGDSEYIYPLASEHDETWIPERDAIQFSDEPATRGGTRRNYSRNTMRPASRPYAKPPAIRDYHVRDARQHRTVPDVAYSAVEHFLGLCYDVAALLRHVYENVGFWLKVVILFAAGCSIYAFINFIRHWFGWLLRWIF